MKSMGCFCTLIVSFLLLTGCNKTANSHTVDSVSAQKRALGYDIKFIELDQLTFHYIEAGSGELIVFLHGFPHFSGTWNKLLTPLSEQYHVVAPDNRGYGYSDKPENVDDYKIGKLVEDVRLFITKLSPNKKVIVVGHDWGGVLAWGIAQKHPELVSKVVAINAPPFNAFIQSLVDSEAQRNASHYVPKMKGLLAKAYLAYKGDEAFWGEAMQTMHAQGHIDDTYKHAFIDAWAQPGAVQSSIDWYRANVPEFDQINESTYWPDPASEQAIVNVPSLLIWSKYEEAFTEDTFNEIPKHVKNLTVKLIDTASHTPQLDHSQEVLSYIQEFISQ